MQLHGGEVVHIKDRAARTDNRTMTGNYARHLAARHLRPATIDAYTGWLRRLADWADAPLLDLTADDLEAWIAVQRWSPASHCKAVQAVRGFYRWAHRADLIDADPSAGLHPARVPASVPHPCPEDVYRAALDAAHGDAYWRLRLAADTGLRRTELAAVHCDDVNDLAAGPMLRVDGKGGVVRWVPLPADLADWLRLQRGYVFGSGAGHMQPGPVGRWYFRRIGTGPHALRHRYATLAYRSSRDINAVKALLGHSSVTTTQIYIAVVGAELIEAASGAWQAA
ncbi:MAG: tyrosine-type recombinase/integrase [Candidatus Nanopelagicales bacterium]